MAGVGKTALAVNAASTLGRHFPDGQLYIDLRAHARIQEPLNAASALASLLRLLGVPAGTIPSELDERTALWRTLLAHKRAVIILDDAAHTDQVRPLLPGPSPSLIIITSRRHLAGLPGAQSLALDVLPPEDSVALFRAFAGHDRTQDATGISRIVDLCGHLPLAIEIAANRFNARPAWSLAHLRERLTRGPGRLAELHDGYSEVARAFEMSYQTLTGTQRSVFRRLSLHLAPSSARTRQPRWSGCRGNRPSDCSKACCTATCCRNPPPTGTASTICSANTHGPWPTPRTTKRPATWPCAA